MPLPPAEPPLPWASYSYTLYVDASSGSDSNDGGTMESALATISKAANIAKSSTAILVASGSYSNSGYGSGSLSNAAAVQLSVS